MILSSDARAAQARMIARMLDGGTMKLFEADRLVVTMKLPDPAFIPQDGGMRFAGPVFGVADTAGMPTRYCACDRDGDVIIEGEVGKELTLEPAKVLAGQAVVFRELTLG